MTIPTLGTLSGRKLVTDLQSFGLQIGEQTGGIARKGGAGPSDHKTITIAGQTVMVPVYTSGAQHSPFQASPPDQHGTSMLLRDGRAVGTIHFPAAPRFYGLSTTDGIPYWKIALLHGRDTLATTVHQTCIRYADRRTSCQFCAIGQSLEADRTIAYKTPAQLAEVAKAAVELDGVRDMVLTTGTPNVVDRGAAVLAESARAIKAAVDLPLQVQCEPPRDHGWFQRLREAGADSLGMHLEAATQVVREKIMPGKATVSVDRYMDAFASAVPIFGRGQVNTYILAGLGDSTEDILALAERLIALGVYPFVVPFVPISGTPLENHVPPSAEFMKSVLAPLGRMLREANMKSTDIRAGCGRCGACSSLSAYEQ
ncbi:MULTISPECIES: MSMEG_0568 family radical SAM protein [Acetobacteraceae]|uniref:Radical SAM protein n=3 Tax=Acetobacteraceae TaxID=433 RepID=A0A2V4RH45_9PROT|nr:MULTISPECIES: MSMEG_0568 family radical SAM protein [Acetobacteraceae]AHI27319.1 iron-molybdenum cofactorbiosynthesis nitrogenase NifB [Komagataeibacter xylinus E25]PYD68234.1 radical SAM protein [Komagataeibacter swingsii]PYD74620.1 radical SAM protein [Novacetimonas pomaceti]GBQ57125.1 iron-molybdenum cofactor biosynthesis nitrogenase NifB [Komagataeibacter swingsii DSM 16373]